MPIKLANNAFGTLATAINASDTGIALTTGDGAAFPTLSAGEYFYATITSTQGTQEIVKVTARSGDSLTVVRAQEGTLAAGFAVSARFELRVTAQSVLDAVGDVVASQVGFTPFGNLSATDVQAAIQEEITDLAASSGSSLVGFLQSGTGAVATTVQSKLRETVSVKDFGAVGDGVTDDWAAFQAAHDSLSASNSDVGGEIYIPSGSYYLSQTWNIRKRVTIRGTNAGDQPQTAACILKFPADTDGIRFWSSIDSSTGTNATQSRLINVEVKANAKNVSGVGIKATTTVRIEHCIVRDFKNHGIEFHGQTGSGATGIADFWAVKQTRIVTCGGHGLYCHGNDSQIGVAEQVECVANGGYGFYDISSYGNTYIACQAAGNVAGSYYNISATTYYGSTYLGCYVEFGTGQTATLNSDSIVIGGVLAAVANTGVWFKTAYPGGTGVNVPTGGRHMWFRNNVEIARIETNNVLYGLLGSSWGTATNYTSIGDFALISQVTSTAAAQDRMRFDNPNGRVGSISTSGTSTAYNTSSDYRLKTDVKPMVDAIQKIAQLNPCTFTWKTDGAAGQGFIAHELQAVIPECVTGVKDAVDSEGKPIYQGADVSFLVPTLVKACQEMIEKINTLESKLAGVSK